MRPPSVIFSRLSTTRTRLAPVEIGNPIGAYDAQRHQVLIFDVDRQWYVPYWSGDDKLLAALLRPAPAEHGVLAGQTGSLIRVYRARTL